MEDQKTLRDELAMSLSFDAIPTIEGKDMVDLVSKKLGLEWSNDPVVQIEWAMKYQAIIRYMYADAMLKCR